MSFVELDASVLPTPLAEGGFGPPEQVFSIAKIDQTETRQLIGVVNSLIEQSTGDPKQIWEVQTEHLLGHLPWLRPWSERADEFLSEYGSSITPQISRDEGFSLKPFLSRPSEDHVDLPRFLPATLSIGLMGTRELVGILQPSPEAAIELAAKLIRDETLLRTFDEIDGVPVERLIVEPGDVVTIGGFATLHSGSPLGNGVALAIANRNRQDGSDPQYIIDHYREFYPDSM